MSSRALPEGFLARSIGRIQPAQTIAANQKARDLKAQRRDVPAEFLHRLERRDAGQLERFGHKKNVR